MRSTTVRGLCIALLVLAVPVRAPAQGHFLRGDSNHDREVDVSDAVFTLLYLFAESEAPPCLDALDIDDGGTIAITDAIALLGYAFTGGPRRDRRSPSSRRTRPPTTSRAFRRSPGPSRREARS